MKSADKQRFIDAALAIANKVRAELGFPPVDHIYKGNRADHNSCPITNTIYDDDIDPVELNVDTYEPHIAVYDPGRNTSFIISQNRQSRAFVENFDKGRLPEFEL